MHIVRELLKQGYEVTLLNRGVTPSPFEGDPRVRTIRADRFEDRDAVADAIASEEWSGVVDTTCFDIVDATTVVDAIASLKAPPRCVYISTDSVFAACERVQKDALVEADAVRATSRQAIAELKRRDSYQYGYGSAKLDAEEVYATIDSVSLRLPDVIGPRDNLGGFLDLVEAAGRGRDLHIALTLDGLLPDEGPGSAAAPLLAGGGLDAGRVCAAALLGLELVQLAGTCCSSKPRGPVTL